MTTKISYSDDELIFALKARDITAFEHLYDRYAGCLYAYMHAHYLQSNLIEDIIHELFMLIWRDIDQYDPGKSRLFTWMFCYVNELAGIN